MNQNTFTASLLLAAFASADFPSIQVTVDGVETTLYVHYPSPWSEAEVSGDSMTSPSHNNRIYLSRSPSVDPTQYFTPNLLGGYLEYDVDLSEVGCGCITAFYGVLMPGLDNSEDPFQYCGAGSSAKAACPEFDIMEANKFGFRSTSHKCEPPNDDLIFSECDSRGQCTVDVLRNDIEADYGPGPEYTIDTTRLFSVRADYQESDSRWTAFTITLRQDDREVVMSVGDCTYLQGMTWNITRGMAFVFSNWTPRNMEWIQHGTCEGACEKESVVTTIKNMRFSTSGAIDSYNDYTTYAYGYKCTENLDQSQCDSACENCHISWPFGDQLEESSPDAACRCMPKQRAPQGYTYGANTCSSPNAGLCDGCAECRWSWPSDDPLRWASAEALCRCMPEDQVISFGGSCANLYNGECGADCQSCHWSWPSEDPDKWNSEEANCRCPASDIKEVVFGGNCGALNYGLCGSYCRECRWSWLAEDLDQWAGETANCRCKNWWGQ